MKRTANAKKVARAYHIQREVRASFANEEDRESALRLIGYFRDDLGHEDPSYGARMKNGGFLADAWGKVKGRLAKLVTLLKKSPKIMEGLAKIMKVREISVRDFERFVAEGKKLLKKGLEAIRPFLVVKKDLPTLTDLIKRTAMGARVWEYLETRVKPKMDELEAVLKQYIPTLTTLAKAAIFAWIWFNVDELSWKPDDLMKGFTGQLTLGDLILSLPESGIGAISSSLFGIGYTIMPYILLARLLWLARNKYIEYRNGEWVPFISPAAS